MSSLKKTYLSLGSNLGNKLEHLQNAINAIHTQIGSVLKVSSVYKTSSWGFSGNDFLNICIEIQTVLSSEDVLQEIVSIEKKLGRIQKTTNGYEDRVIDIDILCYKDEVFFSEALIIPHPKMLERNFVLVPLNEIASNFIHPIQKSSISKCLKNCIDRQEVKLCSAQLIKPKSLREHYNYIAIEGNIGAGKTSLAEMLANDFHTKLVLERFAENPFLPKFYGDKQRFAFLLEMSFLTDRYQQINENLRQCNVSRSFTISDYYFFKSLIFAKVTLQKEEFQLYKNIFEIMHKEVVKPDLFIYLHQEPERLLENIKKRGRVFEQNINVSYLETIHNEYLTYINAANYLNFAIIDVSNLDFVKNTKDYNLILTKIKSIKKKMILL